MKQLPVIAKICKNLLYTKSIKPFFLCCICEGINFHKHFEIFVVKYISFFLCSFASSFFNNLFNQVLLLLS